MRTLTLLALMLFGCGDDANTEDTDVDTAVCTDGDTREAACGLNDRGLQTSSCVDGAWVGNCVDPDEYTDGDVELVDCWDGRGQDGQECVEGAWAPLDCMLNEAARASVDSAGVAANGRSRNPVLSRDGRWVVFNSEASNLAVEDANTNGMCSCMICRPRRPCS